MGNLDRTLQPIPAAVNRHYHRQPEQLEFAAARGKATIRQAACGPLCAAMMAQMSHSGAYITRKNMRAVR